MKRFTRFLFDSFSFDAKEQRIELCYALDDGPDTERTVFTERILFPVGTKLHNLSGDPAFERALFALHLIGGISYYKTCLPKTLVIRSGSLTEQESAFWHDVYENGLGEFFYKNEIDFRDLIKFPATKESNQSPVTSDQEEEPSGNSKLETRSSPRALVPIGGGKDSLVTIELLKKAGIDTTLFRLGNHPLIAQMAETAGLPLLTAERHLDGELFKLNAAGALNGHVPITAYLSVLSVLVAMLTDHDTVVFSNERSANEGNVTMHGKEINHQWSKSLDFERAFQRYLKDSIGADVAYFSLLRPLSELHIAKLLAEHPQYFGQFTSCNANWRILKEKPGGRWCGHCPKCAFAFVQLSAFLSKEDLMTIFGKNLFEDVGLLPLYRELLGLEGLKPFECVGTPEETEAAFLLAHDRGEFEGTPAMELYVHEVRPKRKDPEDMVASLLTPTADHAIPQAFQALIPN